MIKHIFFDFNGTIINDVDLCLDLLNEILRRHGKKELSKEEYKDVFKFPVKQYYIDAGVDLTQDSFEDLSKWFINEYQPKSFECGLYENSVECFKYLKEKGYKLYILSASEKNNLLQQTDIYDITKYFEAVLGIDNIYAASKVVIAQNYIKEHNINPNEVLFIGDTLHDVEVARTIGAKPMLVSCGHQSKNILTKGHVLILESIAKLRGIL